MECLVSLLHVWFLEWGHVNQYPEGNISRRIKQSTYTLIITREFQKKWFDGLFGQFQRGSVAWRLYGCIIMKFWCIKQAKTKHSLGVFTELKAILPLVWFVSLNGFSRSLLPWNFFYLHWKWLQQIREQFCDFGKTSKEWGIPYKKWIT